MFGKGKIDIAIQKSHYAPGDIVSGNVSLTLKKPVKAREVSISIIGEHKTTQTTPGGGGPVGGAGMGMSTTTKTVRIYDFEQQLDGEKEYSQEGEYRFEVKIPADTLSMRPQTPEVEGKLGQVLKVAQTAAAMTGAIPFQRIKWYLLAKLDIPGGLDISKKVDITIAQAELSAPQKIATVGSLGASSISSVGEVMALKVRPKIRGVRLLTAVVILAVVAAIAAATVVAAVYVPQIAIWVPIITLGLALALQKYTASFLAYFVITFSDIYGIGDRIRISNVKGDVRRVGLLHTILEEVGEDEKLGGEVTGRLLHVPNMMVLDQPVLNYSKDYSVQSEAISSDYMFDEVRIPLTTESNIEQASKLLEAILKSEDEVYLTEAGRAFQAGYPQFLNEATSSPRVLIHIEPERVWIKGKFVAPLRGRNDLRSRILLRFLKEANMHSDIKLA